MSPKPNRPPWTYKMIWTDRKKVRKLFGLGREMRDVQKRIAEAHSKLVVPDNQSSPPEGEP